MSTLVALLLKQLWHYVRCAVVAVPVLTFVTGGYFNGGNGDGAFFGAVLGFGIGVILAFPDEPADALEN